MFYKSVVVECSTGTEDLAKAIEKKAEEMMKKGTFKFIEQQLSVDISSSVILTVGGHLYPKPLQKAKGTF